MYSVNTRLLCAWHRGRHWRYKDKYKTVRQGRGKANWNFKVLVFAVSTKLSLPIHEHSQFLHFFRTSLISLSSFVVFTCIGLAYLWTDLFLSSWYFWCHCKWYCLFNFQLLLVYANSIDIYILTLHSVIMNYPKNSENLVVETHYRCLCGMPTRMSSTTSALGQLCDGGIYPVLSTQSCIVNMSSSCSLGALPHRELRQT